MTLKKSLEEAQKDLAEAKSNYRAELERDIHRREGSSRQELMREKIQEDLKNAVEECERAVKEIETSNKKD